MGQKVRLTESQLNEIIKECVNEALDEAWNSEQFANFAGQAYGAMNTLGGRLRGMFDHDWKNRKTRQMLRFADMSLGKSGRYSNSLDKSDDSYRNADTYRERPSCYNVDLERNDFNHKEGGGDSPYKVRRAQFDADENNKVTRRGPHHGERKTADEYKDELTKKGEYSLADKTYKIYADNKMLNKAFKNGRDSAMGKGGETGMSNRKVKRSGELNRGRKNR